MLRVIKNLLIVLSLVFNFLVLVYGDFSNLLTESYLSPIYYSETEKEYIESAYKNGEIKNLEVFCFFASGVFDQKKISEYISFLDNLEKDIKNTIPKEHIGKRYSVAKYIFEYLHQKVFKKYLEKATDLDILINTGNYNCVSSTAFYNIVLKRFGIDARAIELPDHIFTVFYVDNYRVEVETTTKYGFDVLRNTNSIKEFEKLTSFRYIPEGKGKRREIGDKELIASMYNNQVLLYKDIGAYEIILKNSLKAIVLDPKLEIAYTNLRSAYLGVIKKSIDERDFPASIALAKEALKIFPGDRDFEKSIQVSYNNNVLYLVSQKKFKEAFDFVKIISVEKQFVSGEEVGDFWGLLVYKWGDEVIKSGRYDEIFYIVDSVLKEYSGSRDAIYRNFFNLVLNSSKIFANNKEFSRAVNFHKEALKRFPEGKELYSNLGYFYNSWGSYLVREGKFEEAIDVFEEAIYDLPDDKVIKENASVAYAKISESRFKMGDFESAVKFISKAMETYYNSRYNDIRRLYYISWVKNLALERENFAEAKVVLREAMKYYPKDPSLIELSEYLENK